MADALAAMLPFAVGILISPLPVAAVIMLLVSDGGTRKATVFEATWLLVSFTVVLGVAALIDKAAPHTATGTPTWEAIVMLALGIVMLALALLVLAAWRRQRRTKGDLPIPRWMHALDGLSAAKTAGLAAVLIVANPVNASMLIAAGIALGRAQLPGDEDALTAVLFTVIASLTMLAPWAITVLSGRGAGLLPRMRHWLLLHNNALTFWMTLAFGLVFLVKGLRALI
ncbi:GAP family protein [Glycomyces paridis]|uniref:GAP family protein n=1 Tax=Glycomyces paridis TaxID=2126555 RepID=A0A4S8PKI3_9ACTN|nr:GAP family protein [Glycomyces paridis]THV28979.1 hypothetical protein E9998_09510 [Glycomyces paridis]